MGKLLVQGFFAGKRVIALDRLGFAGTAVINMTFLNFCCDHHAADPAAKKPGESLGNFGLGDGFTSLQEYLLHFSEQFLCDEWLMNPYVDLATIAKEADVEGVGE